MLGPVQIVNKRDGAPTQRIGIGIIHAGKGRAIARCVLEFVEKGMYMLDSVGAGSVHIGLAEMQHRDVFEPQVDNHGFGKYMINRVGGKVR